MSGNLKRQVEDVQPGEQKIEKSLLNEWMLLSLLICNDEPIQDYSHIKTCWSQLQMSCQETQQEPAFREQSDTSKHI